MVVVVVMVDRHTNGLPMVREEAEGGGGRARPHSVRCVVARLCLQYLGWCAVIRRHNTVMVP